LKKAGIVCFSAEHISLYFPIPWGLRIDGESILAIRNNGWLELGFTERYLKSALARYGWRGLTIHGKDSPWYSVIFAKRIADWDGVFDCKNGM